MSDKKELILHIGYPKTGTTTIQIFCKENMSKLKELGYLYPESCRQLFGHHILAKYYYKLKGDVKWIKNVEKHKAYSDLKHEINKSRTNKVILSSEVFIQAQPDLGLKEDLSLYFPDWNVKIIAFLRRQDKLLESLCNQLRKTGNYNESPESFLEQRYKDYDYLKIMNVWKEYFGLENVKIVPFEKDQWMNSSLEHEFLRCIGINSTSLFKYPKVTNSKLSQDCLDFLSLTYPDSNRIGGHFRTLIELLEKYSALNPDPPEYMKIFSPDTRLKVYNYYKESNSKVAKKYLNREDGTLYYETPPDAYEIWEPYPGISNISLVKMQRYLLDRLIFDKIL